MTEKDADAKANSGVPPSGSGLPAPASERADQKASVPPKVESQKTTEPVPQQPPHHHRPPRTENGWRIEGNPPTQGKKGADNQPQGKQQPPPGLRWINRIWLILLVALLLNWIVVGLMPRHTPFLTISYTFFRQQVEAGNVAEITSQGSTIQGIFKKPVTEAQATSAAAAAAVAAATSTTSPAPTATSTAGPRASTAPGPSAAASATPTPSAAASATPATGSATGGSGTAYTEFQTQLPAFGNDDLLSLLMAKGVVVNAKPLSTGTPLWETILLYFGPALFFIALFVWIGRRAQAGGGMLSAFGRSRARRYEATQQRTTFADVAGIDEAKLELGEVVGFLRDPDRYRRLGARIPRGVLLSGPPGTGKTLLARAVAGEANVPFFWLSASEFVEVLVGVGASRVRDLFQQAKAAAPAIIFIDELDAIGRARSSGPSFGGNDEREQTLNQILTEMDGFSGTEGVIVMAATNRPEILDPALLRPGRFDRRIVVNPPDQRGRAEILRVHTRHVPLGHVDLERIASETAGMVGADLANLVNEAALIAARRRHDKVQQSDFSAALERLILGSERRIVLSPLDRERTAYHESGHALLGMLQPGADPVRKVSIVPRGQALGVTFQSPQTDRYGYAASYLRGRIIGALGGRAAEELIYGDITTGAESDLEQVTAIARQMVGRWGMSEAIGPVTVMPRNPEMAWPGLDGANGPSDETRRLVDAEVRRIVEECYTQALDLLRENRDKLDKLAHALLEKETLDEDEAYAVVGIPHEASKPEAIVTVPRSVTGPTPEAPTG